MAVITPNTELRLLKVPLEIDEINQLTFTNAEAQYNYFNNLPKLTVDDFTYQRKDGTIRFGANFDEILTYNYVMYQNTEYSNKWFYAFITDMQYVNDNMTMITIKTDVWQTWQFDLNFKPCLIDREHVNDDTVGKNTLPEGLELGEMVVNGNTTNFGLMSSGGDYVTVVDVTMLENSGTNQTLSYYFDPPIVDYDLTPAVNGIPSGVIHIIIGLDVGFSDPEAVVDVYNYAGLTDAIINCYILPRSLINQTYVYRGLTISGGPVGSTPRTASGLAILAQTSSQTNISTQTFNRPSSLDSYTPKNNKLKTFPYCYFNISNNAGTSIDFHYEDFSTSNVSFKLEGAFCPSGSVKAIPQNYKNIGSNGNAYDYSVNGAKYPIISWNSDSYTNWLTQNAVNMREEWSSAYRHIFGNILGGASALGLLGSASGTAESIGELLSTARSEMQAKSNANLKPDQVNGNVNAGDLVWSKLRSNFTYLPMSIKAEYARCIDEYLSEFGYKCNRVKIPNITGRRNWNYVKTIGCYIDADIPQTDLQEIKNMFDRGVTFWHNPATFADYSQNNDII